MGEMIKPLRPDYNAQEIALKVQYYNILMELTYAYWIVQPTCYHEKLINLQPV